jgi:mannose-6-phosphate isomerase-like protein (cupin superfamily)
MFMSPLNFFDLQEIMDAANGKYTNVPLNIVNDHIIRISVMTEPFYWHYHPDSDEVFLGVEGTVIIELEDSHVELAPGQLFTVPKNVPHRTLPKGGRSVNLTFERKDMETVVI